MYIRLATDLKLGTSTVYDTTLGVRYILSDDALRVLRLLHLEPDPVLLLPLIARDCDVGLADARQAFYALLAQLDTYGGVRAEGIAVREWLYRARTGSFWRIRYCGSAYGFLRSMLRAYGALTLAGTFVFVCLKVLAGPALPSMWVLLPGMLLTSCAIHEAGHAYAARLLKVPFVFLAKPGAASILYARPGQFQEHWIALSGPLLAAILCIVVACIIGLLQLRFIAIATGLIHLYSLSPWMADGKSIWRK